MRGNGSARLGARQLYLLRNLSRGKGVGFFEATNFYPDFILWLVDGPQQTLVFIDPKGLAMLRPNDFSHPKIQLYQTLQTEIMPQLPPNPNLRLDAYIISAQPYTETAKYFGDPNKPYSPAEFSQHHVLFPGQAAAQLLATLIPDGE